MMTTSFPPVPLPSTIRSRFEERFSVGAMARDYVTIYETLAASGEAQAVAAE